MCLKIEEATDNISRGKADDRAHVRIWSNPSNYGVKSGKIEPKKFEYEKFQYVKIGHMKLNH